MEQIMEYIKPELLVLVPVLFFIGKGLKQSEVKDKQIPTILTLVGVFLSLVWILSTSGLPVDVKGYATFVFVSITQGVLLAGGSVLTDNLIKQGKKVE